MSRLQVPSVSSTARKLSEKIKNIIYSPSSYSSPTLGDKRSERGFSFKNDIRGRGPSDFSPKLRNCCQILAILSLIAFSVTIAMMGLIQARVFDDIKATGTGLNSETLKAKAKFDFNIGLSGGWPNERSLFNPQAGSYFLRLNSHPDDYDCSPDHLGDQATFFKGTEYENSEKNIKHLHFNARIYFNEGTLSSNTTKFNITIYSNATNVVHAIENVNVSVTKQVNDCKTPDCKSKCKSYNGILHEGNATCIVNWLLDTICIRVNLIRNWGKPEWDKVFDNPADLLGIGCYRPYEHPVNLPFDQRFTPNYYRSPLNYSSHPQDRRSDGDHAFTVQIRGKYDPASLWNILTLGTNDLKSLASRNNTIDSTTNAPEPFFSRPLFIFPLIITIILFSCFLVVYGFILGIFGLKKSENVQTSSIKLETEGLHQRNKVQGP